MATTTELDAAAGVVSVEDDETEQASDAKDASKGNKVRIGDAAREAAFCVGALVDGLRHGQLQFRGGEGQLSLSLAQQVVVEVKASKQGDKEKHRPRAQLASQRRRRRVPEPLIHGACADHSRR